MEEAIEILRAVQDDADERIPKMHIVFGAYDGPIDAKPGESVVFIGDCATWRGNIHGKDVDIDSIYVDRSQKDPHTARHEDIIPKMARVVRNLTGKKGQVVRISGCPASVPEQMLALVTLSKLKNPYFVPDLTVPFASAYLSWRSRTALQRAMGQAYQEAGPTPRGRARPAQNLPPEGVPTPLELDPPE